MRANALKANLDNMQSKSTHLEILNSTHLFVHMLERKLNPQPAILIPTVRRELDPTFIKEIPQPINEDEWTNVEAFTLYIRSSVGFLPELSVVGSCATIKIGSTRPMAT